MGVPLVAAAVCPHPPLIVPEIAGSAAPDLDDLRAACDAAVDRLWRSGARRLVVIGADSATREHYFPFVGSFAPWGVPMTVSFPADRASGGPVDPASGGPVDPASGGPVDPASCGPADGPAALGRPVLPLSLLVGAWLLGRADHHRRGDSVVGPGVAERPISYQMFGLAGSESRPPESLVGADQGGPWALLAMGDGSARRGEKAPGYDDPQAQPYDDAAAAALATVDTAALLNLDPTLSAELQVAGRASWQALAATVRAAGGRWSGELTYHAAPYGVGYFVASWERI